MADLEVGAGSTIQIGAPPTWEQRTEAPFSSDTSKSLSKPQLEQAAQSDALTQEQIAGTAPKAKYDTDVAGIQAQDAAAKADILQKTSDEKAAVDEAHASKIAARADEIRQANDAIRATPAPALFADVHGWDKVQRAIGIALAGLGDAMASRSNAILHLADGPSAMTDIINMDLQRQREIIGKLKDNQIMAKEGLKDAQAARDQALVKVDLKGAAMMAQAAARTEQVLKAKGVELPAIQQNETILALKREEQKRKEAAVAGLANEHTSTGTKSETTNRSAPADTGAAGGRSGMAVVKNPDGTDAGLAPTSAAAAVNEATVKRAAAIRALNHYQELIVKSGGRELDPSSPAFQALDQAHNGAIAAITSVTNMPGSDKSTEIEAKRLGPPGTGWSWKANASLVKNLAEDIKTQGEQAIKMTAGTAVQVEKNGETRRPQLSANVASNPAVPPAPPAAPPVATPPVPVTPPMVPPAAAATPAAPAPAGVSVLKSQRTEALRWLVTEGKKPENAAKAQAIRDAYGVK